jgi:ParB-like chromosome segregation protein Spo0J
MSKIQELKKQLIEELRNLNTDDLISEINDLNSQIAIIHPIQHPVNNIQFIKMGNLIANQYNPNKVAPPEMKLLEKSILEDGYTMPIVAYKNKKDTVYTIVDGFHRHRVGKESLKIRETLKGYLPVSIINKNDSERMASTIRHNRARGVHNVQVESEEIVAKLVLQGWSDKRIREELGYDEDELNRKKQITGLGILFKNREFSMSWEIANHDK